HLNLLFCFLMLPPLPRSTLFPYTTLFRSHFEFSQEFQKFALRFISRQQKFHFAVQNKSPLRHAQQYGWESVVKRIVLNFYDYIRSKEHTSELQSRENLVCRLLLEKKKK